MKKELIKEDERFLNTPELEDIIGVKRMTLYLWRKKGLPYYQGPSKISPPMYLLSEVKEWLKENNLKYGVNTK